MPELHDAQALASAAKEGAEHLEHLREAGMLGVARAVTARAEPLGEAAPPEGSETKTFHFIRHGQGFHSAQARPQHPLPAGRQPSSASA